MSQETKRALGDALRRLLLQKPLRKITIGELTKETGISRVTFYHYFKDIYDLLEWSFVEDCICIPKTENLTRGWEEYTLETFRSLQKNKPFILNICRSISWERLEQYLYERIYPLVYAAVRVQMPDVPEKDVRFIADFYKSAFVGIMLSWLRSRLDEEPEVIVDRLSRLLSGQLSLARPRFVAEGERNG